jgi:hypothetical protein
MAKKPNRVPPSVVIDKAEEGGEIDLDLLIANKTFYQLVYKEAIDSISDAITSRSKTATLFELNKSEHYIEIDKPQWKQALETCIEFYLKTEDYEICSKIKNIIDKI